MKKLLLLLCFFLSISINAQPPSDMPPYYVCDFNNDGFETFDLSSQIPAILNGLNPNTSEVSFYETLTDSQIGSNAITAITSYNNITPQVQTLYIRVLDTTSSEVYFSTLDLVVNASTYAGLDGGLTICDNSTTPINLFSIITGEQPGGTWTRTTGTGGTLDAISGIFTPGIGATTSTFVYTMSANQSCPNDRSVATVTLSPCNPQVVCGGLFTDPAGANANYANNSDYTVTILPTNPGEVVTVTFTAFNTEVNWDALYVFNGNSTTAPQISSGNGPGNVPGGLAGGFWGNTIPGPFTSSSPDGSLTFRFRSDNSGIAAGWIANVTCNIPPACSLPTSLTISNITTTSVILNWTQLANANNTVASAWEVIALPCGSPAPTDTSTGLVYNTTTYVFSDLVPGTCYSFCVRAICSANERSLWNCFGNVTTLTPPPACGGQFVDNGGASANYSDSADNTNTICGTNPGDIVTVTFTSFNTEAGFDALYVFDGNSIAAPQIPSTNAATNVPGGLAGGYWGTAIPGPFTSSSPDGCLTFRFRSDTTINRAGWIANITCAPAPTCPRPTTLSAINVTTNSATFNWVESGFADQWEIVVLPVGSPIPNANTVGTIIADNPSTSITTLASNTCYTFYVRALCSDTDKSTWAGGFNFCTLLGPPICGGQFTDNAGANANYANNSDNTYTICPTNPGEIVTVVFNTFDVEATWDALYVFDGNSIMAPQIASANPAGNVPGGLAGGFWGTTIPGPFTSTSPDGCLTFRFRSDNTAVRAGWTANVICAPDSDKIVLLAYVDQNSNGTKDVGEPLFPHGNFIYQQNNNGTSINGYSPTGQFALYDTNPANTYSFSYQVHSGYAAYYNSGTTSYNNISIAVGSGSQFLYFPVTLTQAYNDVTISIAPINAPRPGFTYTNRITYKNVGVAATGGTITFVKPTQVTANVVVSQTGATINTTGFTYNFTNLLPNETRTFTVTMTVPAVPLVNINELLTATASITAPAGDINLENNSNNNSQIVVNSWDPNDKIESRGKTIPFNTFTQDDYFFYTIRFQNNGTANAIDVRIEDVLNAQIDETSVLMVSSSHNYTMKRINNQLVWDFKNIFLTPSSLNENSSKGYVQFKVKLKPGFEAGDIIPNNASIYFDANPAIVTATFNSKFTVPLSVSDFDENSLVLYPNPASNSVQIDLINTYEQLSRIVFYDLLGKAVKTISSLASESLTIDVSDLSKGLYLVEIITDNNLKTTKKLLVN